MRVRLTVAVAVLGLVAVGPYYIFAFRLAAAKSAVPGRIAARMGVGAEQVRSTGRSEWTVCDQRGGVLAVVTWSPLRGVPSSVEFSQTALPPVASLTDADIRGPALELITRWYGLMPEALSRSTVAQTTGFTRAAFEFRPDPRGMTHTVVAVDVDSRTKRIVAVWGPGRHARSSSRFVTPFGLGAM